MAKHTRPRTIEEVQEGIRRQWPAQIQLACQRLCAGCRHQHCYQGYQGQDCHLVPITSRGEDCPYYSPAQTLVSDATGRGTGLDHTPSRGGP